MSRAPQAVPGAAAQLVPTGNTYDKYGSKNPVVRRMMDGFERSLAELFTLAAPQSVLDVGCGEGVLTEQWAAEHEQARIVGVDLADPKLEGHWRARKRPNLEFLVGRAQQLPFAAAEFDLVAAIEALEHILEPEIVLGEMTRVARRHLLVSVPREPLWRGLNIARGGYLRDLGNTPGHVNHWSKVGFHSLLTRYGSVQEVRTPFPWTMLLVGVG
jgi:2-polyprenyl-3-methyl-5-hydroxy-6-metoxy-1,4-benzoquinol methylase